MHGYIQLILPAGHVKIYCTSIKFRKLIFHVFDWQENLWDINFCGHGGVVGTIIVGFAKHASYCGLIFVDRGIPQNLQNFMHIENFYAYGMFCICFENNLLTSAAGMYNCHNIEP